MFVVRPHALPKCCDNAPLIHGMVKGASGLCSPVDYDMQGKTRRKEPILFRSYIGTRRTATAKRARRKDHVKTAWPFVPLIHVFVQELL